MATSATVLASAPCLLDCFGTHTERCGYCFGGNWTITFGGTVHMDGTDYNVCKTESRNIINCASSPTQGEKE